MVIEQNLIFLLCLQMSKQLLQMLLFSMGQVLKI